MFVNSSPKVTFHKHMLPTIITSKSVQTGTPERGAGGSRRPSSLSVGGAGGAKVPLLNAMICFLIVNMIQRRSYKPEASNI